MEPYRRVIRPDSDLDRLRDMPAQNIWHVVGGLIGGGSIPPARSAIGRLPNGQRPNRKLKIIMMSETKNKVQEEIIRMLKEQDALSFGDLVMKLKRPYHEVLMHVLELKRNGAITKMKSRAGSFALTGTDEHKN